MHTPTHLLIGAAALTRRGERARNIAAIAGSLVPDSSIYVMWGWARLVVGMPEREVWRRLYWTEGWQMASAAVNSVPIYAALLVLGLSRGWTLLTVFAAAALLHVAFDFPFHNQDAHRHFWPFTDWRFHSPLSYWNDAHYGQVVGAVEVAGALMLLFVLWHRFKAAWVRLALLLALTSYVAVPVYFSAM